MCYLFCLLDYGLCWPNVTGSFLPTPRATCPTHTQTIPTHLLPALSTSTNHVYLDPNQLMYNFNISYYLLKREELIREQKYTYWNTSNNTKIKRAFALSASGPGQCSTSNHDYPAKHPRIHPKNNSVDTLRQIIACSIVVSLPKQGMSRTMNIHYIINWIAVYEASWSHRT